MSMNEFADRELDLAADQIIDLRQIEKRQHLVRRIEEQRPLQDDEEIRVEAFQLADDGEIAENRRVGDAEERRRRAEFANIPDEIVDAPPRRLVVAKGD